MVRIAKKKGKLKQHQQQQDNNIKINQECRHNTGDIDFH